MHYPECSLLCSWWHSLDETFAKRLYAETMINQNFVIVGTILAAIGTFSYLVDTVKGKVKPNRVSFFLWALGPLIAFAAELKQGVGLPALMTFTVGFLPLTIFFASFVNQQAKWKLTRFDFACGALSLLGLLLWYLTKSGNVAIIFSILADGLATLPTVVKSFNFPETESAWPYIGDSLAAVITLLTVKVWDLPNVGFPLYILLITLVIAVLVQFKLGKKIQTRVSE